MPFVDLYDCDGVNRVNRMPVYLAGPSGWDVIWQGRSFVWSDSAQRYCETHSPAYQEGELAMKPTAEQKAAAQAMGIDLTKIDWKQWASILQLILSMFQAPTPTMRTAKAGCESQEAACCKSVCKAAEALTAALECHQTCCEG